MARAASLSPRLENADEHIKELKATTADQIGDLKEKMSEVGAVAAGVVTSSQPPQRSAPVCQRWWQEEHRVSQCLCDKNIEATALISPSC